MNQHLIALDLDGTLLNSDQKISNRSKKAIAHLKRKGHKVVIATGRPFHASENYYHELELDTPIVNFNGAYIHNPHDTNFGHHHSPLDFDVAKSILNKLNSLKDVDIMAEILDEVFLEREKSIFEELYSFGTPTIRRGSVLKSLQNAPTSIILNSPEESVAEVKQHLDLHHGGTIEHRSWGKPSTIIEITRAGLNKAKGLQMICDYYDIPVEKTVAFGDEDNDLEMIEFVGKGVAMGNAIPRLKELANHVTSSNNEDGVAVVLEELADTL